MTLALVNCALAEVRPDDSVSVALEIFVETAFVFNRVETVEVVTLALVNCALAEVRPVDSVSVALERFVTVKFGIVAFVIYAVSETLIVPVEIFISFTLVVVTFTVTTLPPTTKSPDKLIEPPV